MHRRPLDPRFNQAVLDGSKFTTIRDKIWPIGVPIMLYNWSGAPYRSKQRNVAPIIVDGYWPILLHHHTDGSMSYDYGMQKTIPLYSTEGFSTASDLDAWFRPLIPQGKTGLKFLHRIHLA